MRNAEERVLKDPKQIKVLEEKLGFEYERFGYAMCKLPNDETPTIRLIEIHNRKRRRRSPDLELIITNYKDGFYVVINDEKRQFKYHCELEISEIQADLLKKYMEYLKKRGNQNTRKI